MRRPKPFPAKRVGMLFFLVALAFYAGAAFVLISRLAILVTWPSAQASVIASSVDRFPASDGTLLFRTKLNVSYFVGGQEIFTEALSVNSTPSYADAAGELRRFEAGSTRTIRYNRSNPKEARVDAEISWTYLRPGILMLLLGSAIGATGWMIYRSYRPLQYCAQCNEPLARHYKFCTACAAPVGPRPTPRTELARKDE